MQNNHSSYSRWTWIIAALLALLILWLLLTGRGTGQCCGATDSAGAVVATPVDKAFKFNASSNAVDSTGDSSKVTWFAKSADLKTWLSGGSDWKIEGDANAVTLTGTVDSEEIKTQKGTEAQAFFGQGVTVNNQLQVKAAVATAPQAVKLYFDTAKAVLPQDANEKLAPIAEWLKTNSNAKVAVSGFHDASGDAKRNELLAKDRGKAVVEALKLAGINEANIELRKPENSDGGSDLNEARRVEVSIE